MIPGKLYKLRICEMGTENFMFIERKTVKDRFLGSTKVLYILLNQYGKIDRIYSDFITILKTYE